MFLKNYILAIIVLCVIMVGYTTFFSSQMMGYRVGDCLSLGAEDNVYKVTEIGQYGLRTTTPHYNGYEVYYINSQKIKTAIRVDCFDLFNKE